MQEEERRGLAALLLQHYRRKKLQFQDGKSFQSYNTEEKSNLDNEEEKEESGEINIR